MENVTPECINRWGTDSRAAWTGLFWCALFRFVTGDRWDWNGYDSKLRRLSTRRWAKTNRRNQSSCRVLTLCYVDLPRGSPTDKKSRGSRPYGDYCLRLRWNWTHRLTHRRFTSRRIVSRISSPSGKRLNLWADLHLQDPTCNQWHGAKWKQRRQSPLPRLSQTQNVSVLTHEKLKGISRSKKTHFAICA